MRVGGEGYLRGGGSEQVRRPDTLQRLKERGPVANKEGVPLSLSLFQSPVSFNAHLSYYFSTFYLKISPSR